MRAVASMIYRTSFMTPAFLVVGWRRVRGNRGARTAGVDGVARRSLPPRAERLLVGLRDDLKARRFVPQRVRQKTIREGSGNVRSLGIPAVADWVGQASLKLVSSARTAADIGRSPAHSRAGYCRRC